MSDALRIARRVASPGAVALTFDDGPDPRGTPAVLEILREHDARATFFLIGEQVRRTGSLAAEIAAAGHAIGVHGERHRTLLRLTPRAVADDLDRALETIRPVGGVLHRPPYGVYSSAALRHVRRRGWTPLLWSRWGHDWRARATAAGVAREVTRDLRAGDVLLLHDADAYSAPGSWRTTLAALPRVLEAVAAAGLRARAVMAVDGRPQVPADA
jgi:peptidoglycan/xylan/chitin deacetylase (PgdA/CDA1 family)